MIWAGDSENQNEFIFTLGMPFEIHFSRRRASQIIYQFPPTHPQIINGCPLMPNACTSVLIDRIIIPFVCMH